MGFLCAGSSILNAQACDGDFENTFYQQFFMLQVEVPLDLPLEGPWCLHIAWPRPREQSLTDWTLMRKATGKTCQPNAGQFFWHAQGGKSRTGQTVAQHLLARAPQSICLVASFSVCRCRHMQYQISFRVQLADHGFGYLIWPTGTACWHRCGSKHCFRIIR